MLMVTKDTQNNHDDVVLCTFTWVHGLSVLLPSFLGLSAPLMHAGAHTHTPRKQKKRQAQERDRGR